MALPKHRKSKSKTRMQRARNEKRSISDLSLCPQCGFEKLSHRICPSCGFYKDRVVAAPREKKERPKQS